MHDETSLCWPSTEAINAWATRQNERHRKFWAAKQIDVERQLADLVVRQQAFDCQEDQIARLVPPRFQDSLERCLECAEDYKLIVLHEQARLGGKALKQDLLQTWIEKFVAHRPSATVADLLLALRNEVPGPVIIDVTGKVILFETGRGEALKEAKISGLKDRLSRAKKKVRSQKAASAN